MPDVHLNRRVIFARDQAVRPRALSRDVQIDVISVGVDHCFGGCFVATFAFVTRFAKKKCAFFQEGKEKRVQRLKLEVFFEAKKRSPRPSQSSIDAGRKKKVKFGPRKRHCSP